MAELAPDSLETCQLLERIGTSILRQGIFDFFTTRIHHACSGKVFRGK
jgi:hypothetical protein